LSGEIKAGAVAATKIPVIVVEIQQLSSSHLLEIFTAHTWKRQLQHDHRIV
jgi:hypothetical protein